ncbi:MAG: rod shape-determining protein MreD [Eubacteriales bacterium]|nr:rod shape-determining protein MreD [Eubacteriales bacterium]
MIRKFLRGLIPVIILAILLVLQSSFFKLFTFIPTGPNLLIVVVTGTGFIRGARGGLLIGLAAGLLLDLQYGTNFGLYGLVYMHIGYFSGLMNRIFVKDNLLMLMSMTAVSDIAYNVIIYLFSFLFRQRFSFFNYLFYTMLPEVLLTLLVTLIIYKPLLSLNLRLDASRLRTETKKGEDRFV